MKTATVTYISNSVEKAHTYKGTEISLEGRDGELIIRVSVGKKNKVLTQEDIDNMPSSPFSHHVHYEVGQTIEVPNFTETRLYAKGVWLEAYIDEGVDDVVPDDISGLNDKPGEL